MKHISNKSWIQNIFLKLNNKKATQLKKGWKIWINTLPKKIYQRHINIWKDAQHYLPLGKCKTLQPFRMPKIQKEKKSSKPKNKQTNKQTYTKPDNTNSWQVFGAIYTRICCWWEWKNGTVQKLHSLIFIQFIWNLKSTYTHTRRYTQLFIAALFVMVRYWK